MKRPPAAPVRDLWPRNLIRQRSGQQAAEALVLRPGSAQAVAAALRRARREGRRVVAVGGRSGVCGAIDVGAGELALDLSGLDRILEVDADNLICRVEAGVRLADLEEHLNQRGLTLGHQPSSLPRATVGGLISTRSSGQESTRYGSIEDLLLGVRALLADGTELPLLVRPRSAAGPALHQLLAGAEGGLAVIMEAALRLSRLPVAVEGRGFAFARLEPGLQAIREIVQRGLRPLVLRLYDPEDSRLQGTDEGCLLIAAAAGEPGVAAAERVAMAGICAAATDLGDAPWQRWLRHRYDLSVERLLDMLQPPGAVVETIELVAPWTALPGLHAAVKAQMAGRGLILCHFAHASAQGACAYFTFAGNAPTEAEAMQLYDDFWQVAMVAAQAHGAGISHHHGVGQARAAWIQSELGAWWQAWQRLRRSWDPDQLLNPHAVGGQGRDGR